MKVNIKVNSAEKNLEALYNALCEVQKGCRTRTLKFTDVGTILSNIDSKLSISKAAKNGCVVIYTGAEHFPSSYRGIPESTQFTAVHNGSEWVVTNVERSRCPNRLDNVYTILTDVAKQKILERMERFMV